MRATIWLASLVFAAGTASGAAAQSGGHQHGGHGGHQHTGHQHASPQQADPKSAKKSAGQHSGHQHAGHAVRRRAHADTPAVRDFHAAHADMMRNMNVPLTGDPDIDFRTQMIPHHQGAIDMSRVALRHSKDAQTRQVAEAIAVAQPREINEFQGWLARRGTTAQSGAKANAAAVREYKAAHARMMRNMDMPFTGDPDVDFRMHMIPHHQGAIDMSRVALRHAKDPWTRQNAEAIIIAQQQEIAQFQNWLAQRGKMVPPGGQPRHIVNANSYPERDDVSGLATQAELAGQVWAPGAGVPPQP